MVVLLSMTSFTESNGKRRIKLSRSLLYSLGVNRLEQVRYISAMWQVLVSTVCNTNQT